MVKWTVHSCRTECEFLNNSADPGARYIVRREAQFGNLDVSKRARPRATSQPSTAELEHAIRRWHHRRVIADSELFYGLRRFARLCACPRKEQRTQTHSV